MWRLKNILAKYITLRYFNSIIFLFEMRIFFWIVNRTTNYLRNIFYIIIILWWLIYLWIYFAILTWWAWHNRWFYLFLRHYAISIIYWKSFFNLFFMSNIFIIVLGRHYCHYKFYCLFFSNLILRSLK